MAENPVGRARGKMSPLRTTRGPGRASSANSNSKSKFSGIQSNFSRDRAKLRMRGGSNAPLVSSFGAGAIFGEQTTEDLHPQVIKMARRSGQLNLSNKGMREVPQKVFHINEVDETESRQISVSMDDGNDEKWWEQNELTRLYLSSNCLATISPEISNLSSLQILDLQDNSLVVLPDSLGELVYLQRLNLGHNKLETFPSNLCSLPDLRSLQLDHNCLKELSEDIGNLIVLDYLDISHNKLTEIPAGIGYLQRLSKFNASDNQINNLPQEIGDIFGLTQLDLCQNQLVRLPEEISRLIKLEQLFLRNNKLKELPSLSGCTSLKELHVGNNFIAELTQTQLNSLVSIKVLDLRDNRLETLPDYITFLQGLERLDLTNNNLSTVPYHLSLLPNLKSLPLEGNPLRLIRRDIVQRGTVQLIKYLRSKISAPINSFPGFEQSTELDNCIEDSNIPDKFQMRNTMSVIYNEKATQIPDALLDNAHEATVKTVNFSKNLLTSLPTKLDELHGHVTELVISSNKLESLPSFLGNFRRLMFLDVSGNRLTGLPSELAQLPHIREINISFNKFTEVPECVFEMETLEILFAGDNKIKSINVEGLAKLKRISTLDFRNNNIDSVPHELGNLTQIKSLQLEGNGFRVPRSSILAKGTREILEYLRSRIVQT